MTALFVWPVGESARAKTEANRGHHMRDALFFIDANQYLQLYRTTKGKKLLEAIKEQQEHIFITKQVVDEVQRNKLLQAAQLRAQQITARDQAEGCTTLGDAIRQTIRAENARLTITAAEEIQQVSRSEDDVSMALAELFKTAVVESPDELQRARGRKEKGNPPGKPNDPLGDQLTWEQLLGRAKGKSKVWIVSTDQDYCVKHDGKRFLNSFLYQELAAVNAPPTQVFCFDNLDDGIRDFVKQMGVKAEAALPTPEESREIKEEALRITEELATVLVPVDWLPHVSGMDAINAIIRHARQRNPAIHTTSMGGDPGLIGPRIEPRPMTIGPAIEHPSGPPDEPQDAAADPEKPPKPLP